ncbi:velvet factor [Lipomyces arxii]|uniref:velvet factor n=1 Tax=Lipomyces arxii TaxID=56418 RepID=UPI0034CDC02A
MSTLSPPYVYSEGAYAHAQLQLEMPNERYIYRLEVVQQPIRARMCGFGDKDRRPITPPPCIRLDIIDRGTGLPADITRLDVSFYALTVELWSVDMTQNQSIVCALPISSNANSTNMLSGSAPGVSHMTPTFSAPPIKNLIGSVVATAFKLLDVSGKLGIWFILQDLSVRTEGNFRLKASFVDLGSPLPQSLLAMHGNGPHALPFDQPAPVMVVNTGTARVQATTFSDPFKVYIAKKFPGVIESTELSRCFARQGIKVPIRKDQKNHNDHDRSQNIKT